VYYADYLQLDKVLGAQQPLSKVGADNTPAHEEMLFIVTHQTYELWFKQVLHEVSSVIDVFERPPVSDNMMGVIANRLERVVEILKVLVQQFTILETMYPTAFLEFRDALVPASGFQSRQFRVLENRLGLRTDLRLEYARTVYKDFFHHDDRLALEQSERQASLFDVVERWLERTPFLEHANFAWWDAYRTAVMNEMARQRREIETNPFFDAKDRDANLAALTVTEKSFQTLFDEKAYAEVVLQNRVSRNFSYRAMQAALLISLYKDEPIFQMPHKLLTLLVDIDAQLANWRYRHAAMVQRMIGVKIGTGGSSGYHYLRTTQTDRYKVFVDLYHMSTYLLPRSALPTLPSGLLREMHFFGSEARAPAHANAAPSSSAFRQAVMATVSQTLVDDRD
jgi:tryptophan 2,3-dioxygenase